MSQVSNNPLLIRQLNAEHQISGIPWVVSTATSAIKGHYFTDSSDTEFETTFVSITNTGTSGSLGVSFVSGGFSTSNNFTLAAGETFSKRLGISKLYVSGNSQQPYSIVAGLTSLKETAPLTFLPSDVSNIYAWWKADTGVSTSAGFVRSWTDTISSRLLSTGSAGTSYPTYTTADGVANTKAAITFDGLNDYLAVHEAASAWTFLHQTGSVVICAKSTGAQTLQALWSTAGFTGETGINVCTNWTTAQSYYLTLSVSSSSPQIVQYNQASYPGTNNIIWFASSVDATRFVFQGSNRAFTSALHGMTVNGTATHSFYIGGNTGGSNPFKGNIYEVIIYNRVLTQAEMTNLGRYFVKKYGAAI